MNNENKEQKARSFLITHKKALVITGIVTAVIAVCAAAVIFMPKIWNNNSENKQVNANSSSFSANDVDELSSDEKPSTEQLTFEKNNYSVELGKTVAIKTKYVPQDNKDAIKKATVTYSSDDTDIATVDKDGNVKGIAAGTTGIVAVTNTGVVSSCVVTVNIPKKKMIKNVPYITQTEEYVSGCESVSTVMLLQYYGFKITPDEFIDKYLPTAYLEDGKDGELTGPDIESVFIGSPYSEDSLGCLAPVIVEALNKFVSGKDLKAVDVSGSSMDSLITNYIAKGQPVLIWATMNMWEPVVTYEWKVKDSADYSSYKNGDTCQWLANEHCMVLVGYDEDCYYLNDPLNYDEQSVFEKEIFNERFVEMGRNAVVLNPVIRD